MREPRCDEADARRVPVVRTASGRVRGAWASDIATFTGIPYAQPPEGRLRFRAPERPASWDGVRDATEPGTACPQVTSSGPLAEIFVTPTRQGGACLNLNVWTPDPDARLPVFVWIHGGGFVAGSGSDPLYDGASFARNGIVAVTVNYRLGAAGYLHVGQEITGSGTFALLDQIAALTWVQENIAAFGGDPTNVTVAGESAGAFSIAVLLVAPRAKGLFRRAIAQSGNAHATRSDDLSAAIGREWFAYAGVDPDDPDGWTAITDEQLLAAQVEVSNTRMTQEDDIHHLGDRLFAAWPWLPAWGNDVLPERPIDAIAAGVASDVDLLLGWCEDEMMLFFGAFPLDLGDQENAALGAAFGSAYPGAGDHALAVYREARPAAAPVELLAALETDKLFGAPGVALLDAHAASGPTHAFRFSWPSPLFGEPGWACHAVDIPFALNTLTSGAGARLTGGAGPQSLADDMHGAWCRFVATGDPGWPTYDTLRRSTRDFGAGHVVDDPFATRRPLWPTLL